MGKDGVFESYKKILNTLPPQELEGEGCEYARKYISSKGLGS